MEQYLQLLNYDVIQIKHPQTKKIINLYRTIALRTFAFDDIIIEKYAIGGYVQSLANIDQDTYNWVDGKSKVFDKAVISDGTYTNHNALIFGNAIVKHSRVINYARISGDTLVADTLVTDLAEIRGKSKVAGSELYNSSLIFENASANDCKLYNGANLRGTSISNGCTLYDTSEVGGSANAENCKLTGGAYFKDGIHLNEVIDRDLELKFSDPIQND